MCDMGVGGGVGGGADRENDMVGTQQHLRLIMKQIRLKKKEISTFTAAISSELIHNQID